MSGLIITIPHYKFPATCALIVDKSKRKREVPFEFSSLHIYNSALNDFNRSLINKNTKEKIEILRKQTFPDLENHQKPLSDNDLYKCALKQNPEKKARLLVKQFIKEKERIKQAATAQFTYIYKTLDTPSPLAINNKSLSPIPQPLECKNKSLPIKAPISLGSLTEKSQRFTSIRAWVNYNLNRDLATPLTQKELSEHLGRPVIFEEWVKYR